MDLHGLIDPFWLGRYLNIGAALLAAFVLALLVWACTRIPDRFIGTILAAVGAWAAATWFATFVRRHTRPREGD